MKENKNYKKAGKHVYTCFFCLFMSFMSFSQKLSLASFFVPQYSKTNFEKILINNPGVFKEFYETARPVLPVQGNSYGIELTADFKKYYLSFSIKRSLRGQKSAFAYNYRGSILLNPPPNYGGLYYHFKMRSTAIGLGFGKKVIKRSIYTASAGFGLALDVYETAFLEDFIIEKETGQFRPGCCRMYYSYHTGGYLTNVFRHVESGYFRLEMSLRWSNEIKLWNNVSLGIDPVCFFSTKILVDSPELDYYVPSGHVISAGLYFRLIYNFL